MAADANDKNFIGQPCCDQLLDNVWYDKVDPLSKAPYKLILSICTFGLLAPCLLSFRQEKSAESELNPSQEKHEMMINASEEEKQVLLPKTTKRYVVKSLSMAYIRNEFYDVNSIRATSSN